MSTNTDLDSQDYRELIRLVRAAFEREARAMVRANPLPTGATEPRRPTSRMLALKQLELKLVAMKHDVTNADVVDPEPTDMEAPF